MADESKDAYPDALWLGIQAAREEHLPWVKEGLVTFNTVQLEALRHSDLGVWNKEKGKEPQSQAGCSSDASPPQRRGIT